MASRRQLRNDENNAEYHRAHENESNRNRDYSMGLPGGKKTESGMLRRQRTDTEDWIGRPCRITQR